MVDNIPTSYSGGSYQTDDPNETYYFESLQGGSSLYKYVGDDNIKGGTNALADVQGAAFGNIALGTDALSNLTTGVDNIAIGTGALATITDAQNNIAIGPRALNANLHGVNNICIGANAGENITGSTNIVLNSSALPTGITTGDGNVILGSGANVDNGARSNCILLGQGAATLPTAGLNGDNQLVITNVFTNAAPPNVNWGPPNTYLQVVLNNTISYIPVFIPPQNPN